MSDYSSSFDLSDYYANQVSNNGKWTIGKVPIATPADDVGHKSTTVRADSDEANNTLSFEDMLLLMVTQLQNQTIDNTADTNDMMNQIIQMTVMQAITDMKTQVDDLTEANIMNYTASLVGQTVTMGIVDKNGYLVGEKVGVITATGTYNGQRVVYMGDEMFPLNQIMAVGKLPEKPEAPEEPGEGEDVDKPEGPGDGDGVDKPEGPGEGEGEGGTGEETLEKALG